MKNLHRGWIWKNKLCRSALGSSARQGLSDPTHHASWGGICQSLSGSLRPHHFCLHLPSATMCYWPPVGSMFSPSRWKIADMLRGNCKLSLSLGSMNQANLSSTHLSELHRWPVWNIVKSERGHPFSTFSIPMSLSFSSYRLFAVFDKFLKYSLIVLPLFSQNKQRILGTVECNHEKQYGV